MRRQVGIVIHLMKSPALGPSREVIRPWKMGSTGCRGPEFLICFDVGSPPSERIFDTAPPALFLKSGPSDFIFLTNRHANGGVAPGESFEYQP
jgi:hypothetical protein